MKVFMARGVRARSRVTIKIMVCRGRGGEEPRRLFCSPTRRQNASHASPLWCAGIGRTAVTRSFKCCSGSGD